MYIHMCTHIYIYIYREREREREIHVSLSLSTYIYIYMSVMADPQLCMHLALLMSCSLSVSHVASHRAMCLITCVRES